MTLLCIIEHIAHRRRQDAEVAGIVTRMMGWIQCNAVTHKGWMNLQKTIAAQVQALSGHDSGHQGHGHQGQNTFARHVFFLVFPQGGGSAWQFS